MRALTYLNTPAAKEAMMLVTRRRKLGMMHTLYYGQCVPKRGGGDINVPVPIVCQAKSHVSVVFIARNRRGLTYTQYIRSL